MDISHYRDYLLKAIPTASLASGGRMIHCRCFFCPDSKNPNSKHFYISIPQSDAEPSLYYCHKCHASGVVTHKNLIYWDIYEDNIAVELLRHNSRVSKYASNNKYLNKIHYNVKYNTTSDTPEARYKLNYINNRIGTHFTYEDLRNLKIVLNLYDLINDNYIKDLTRDKNIVDQLDANFLGFLSIDNAFLNMRRVCDEGLVYKSIDKRYINYKLYDKYDTSERFYTIPTRVNLCTPEKTKIHIAEGPFDILSIYMNLRHCENGIYTSIAGSNYIGLCMYFLETYKLPNSEIHIYPDNDKYGSNAKMKAIADYLRPLGIDVYIHRNIYYGEKDFGVDITHIQESIMRI